VAFIRFPTPALEATPSSTVSLAIRGSVRAIVGSKNTMSSTESLRGQACPRRIEDHQLTKLINQPLDRGFLLLPNGQTIT
jgi:hypothetical protein